MASIRDLKQNITGHQSNGAFEIGAVDELQTVQMEGGSSSCPSLADELVPIEDGNLEMHGATRHRTSLTT